MRRFSLILAILAAFVAAVVPARAQEGTPPAGGLGTASVIVGSNGEPIGQVWVTNIVDPFDGFDASSPPDRGFHFVMADITIAATGSSEVPVNTYGFSLVDTDGFVASQTYVYRTDVGNFPDLPGDNIPPGGQASGVVFFSVFNGAKPAIIDFAPTSDQLIKVADLRSGIVAQGTPATVADASGAPVATITVDSITNPLQDFDPGNPPQRGFSYVGVVVTIENTGSTPYSVEPYGFSVVDKEGFVSYQSYLSRTADATAQTPDLQSEDLAPGAKTTGLVAFQVLSGTEIGTVLYAPDSDRRIRVAETADSHQPVDVTPVARPTAAPTPTPDPQCAEASTWTASLASTFDPIGDVFTLTSAAAESGTVDGAAVDSAIEKLDAAIDAIKDSNPPDIAKDAADALVQLLENMKSELDKMKSAGAAGDAQGVKDAAAAIDAAVTGIGTSGPLADLSTKCPDL